MESEGWGGAGGLVEVDGSMPSFVGNFAVEALFASFGSNVSPAHNS